MPLQSMKIFDRKAKNIYSSDGFTLFHKSMVPLHNRSLTLCHWCRYFRCNCITRKLDFNDFELGDLKRAEVKLSVITLTDSHSDFSCFLKVYLVFVRVFRVSLNFRFVFVAKKKHKVFVLLIFTICFKQITFIKFLNLLFY